MTTPRKPAGARVLAGAPIAAEIKTRVKTDVATFRRRYGFAPTLAVVLVGRDAPSAVYLQQILRTCRSVGISGRLVEVPGRATAARVRNTIVALNEDPLVAGIIVQMPLPKRIPLSAVTDTLDPAKDIDGIHPLNAGRLTLGHDGFLPTTAQAALEILKRSGIEIAGKRVVVVGRSNVVGKPAALLFLRENATVTICHSRTLDLAAQTKAADIVVVAAGRPGLITGSMIKRGAIVVDVGINVVGDKLVGDVDSASVNLVAGALTPVPGGVGPVTNALLMTHLVRAAELQARAEHPRALTRRPRSATPRTSAPAGRGGSSPSSGTTKVAAAPAGTGALA
ncbi:MAG TPA: bifunctional 5,10-methylenetetrahydrofolate dehydrogenase/5,10-methenyltetrahydrofolate cyclohydrolase [Candidatus Acidoferrum sp.]|nr:bifunctional 5,10-methylenetetrahydrofolate dehydrogenase/5,10-methenyltetrahydrofolate cyclohydrolase [Candidatus Acidoferrum sp.]